MRTDWLPVWLVMSELVDPLQVNSSDKFMSARMTRTLSLRVSDPLVRKDIFFWVNGMFSPMTPRSYVWPFFGLVLRFPVLFLLFFFYVYDLMFLFFFGVLHTNWFILCDLCATDSEYRYTQSHKTVRHSYVMPLKRPGCCLAAPSRPGPLTDPSRFIIDCHGY